MTEPSEQELAKLIHDVRKPLNRISMQAELIKLVLENDLAKDKAITAVEQIIQSCQDCSDKLQLFTEPK
ncbi:hypothetical protein [Rheinheimera sp. WS51]|uniref:hypothetical protein n=1 Tax=Rheinheimera sp. WS51 TaxID=3425886 RepID=UPI003D8EE4EB